MDGLTLMLHSLLSEIIEFPLPFLIPTVIQPHAIPLTAAVLLQIHELSSDVTSQVCVGAKGSLCRFQGLAEFQKASSRRVSRLIIMNETPGN